MTIVLCDVCKKEIGRNYSVFCKADSGYSVTIKKVGSGTADFSRNICKECADKIESFVKENTKEFKEL